MPAALLELTGTWYWGASPCTLAVEGADHLRLSPPAGGTGRASRFRPAADGGWTGLDNYYAGEPLRVVRDADGAVTHLDLATFVLTRRPYAPGEVVPGGVDERGWHRPG